MRTFRQKRVKRERKNDACKGRSLKLNKWLLCTRSAEYYKIKMKSSLQERKSKNADTLSVFVTL